MDEMFDWIDVEFLGLGFCRSMMTAIVKRVTHSTKERLLHWEPRVLGCAECGRCQ